MKYRENGKIVEGLNQFVAKFYYYKFHKEDLIDWLCEVNYATREELENMSLPLIYAMCPQYCEDLLDEQLEAIYLNEGELK